MPRYGIYVTIMVCFLSGCATGGTTLQVNDLSVRRDRVRSVAVLPMRLDLFRVQAGGNAELIDEWRTEANTHLTAALQAELGGPRGWELTFAEKEYLRQYHTALWRKYRVLFETVAGAAILHGSDITAFPAKMENFDYTLGPGVAELAEVFNADALLFVYGTDYITTTGAQVGGGGQSRTGGVRFRRIYGRAC